VTTFQVFEVGGADRTSKDKASKGRSGERPIFALSPVFRALDAAKLELGIENYTLSQVSIYTIQRRR